MQEGQGSDFTEVQGNGDAGDYAPPTDVPVESDFSQPKATPVSKVQKPIGPLNYNPGKKDTFRKPKKGRQKPASKSDY